MTQLSWSLNGAVIISGLTHSARGASAGHQIKIMKTRNMLFVVLSAAVLAAGLVACRTDKQSEMRLQTEAKVSRTDAEKIALAKVPGGSIKEGEIEREKGKVIWSLDVATPGTTDITEVQVDAMTGEVVAIEKESPAQQAKEKK
jgi:hypothetical protein